MSSHGATKGRKSPALLFPMVGRAFGDQIKVDGVHYPLPQHGFARRSRFAAVEASATRCVLRLEDNEQTRAAYPFAFPRRGPKLAGLRMTP